MPFISTTSSLAMLVACVVLPLARADIGVDLVDESQKHPSDKEDTIVTSNVGLISPVLRLNRLTLSKSLLVEDSSEIASWIVLFCAPWHPACQASEPFFRKQAEHWQGKLNTALFTKEVRFADVDCAVDKALCNSQNVDGYPVAAHYRQGKQISLVKPTGRNDKERFFAWLQKSLASGSQAPMTERVPQDSWQQLSQRVLMKARLMWSSRSKLMGCLMHAMLGVAAIAGMHAVACHVSAAYKPHGGTPSKTREGASVVGRPAPFSSVTARCLPKEWGHDRPSLEL